LVSFEDNLIKYKQKIETSKVPSLYFTTKTPFFLPPKHQIPINTPLPFRVLVVNLPPFWWLILISFCFLVVKNLPCFGGKSPLLFRVLVVNSFFLVCFSGKKSSVFWW
jgi:hypothetical protein